MTLDKLIHPVWIKMYGLDQLEGEVISLPARQLLTPKRFDLFAKLFYIRHRKDRPCLARRVYLESLRSIIPSGKEFGKEEEKNSFKVHISVFDKLIDSFQSGDFDSSVSLVPVSGDFIIDGAHRVAALAFWGKDVTVCKFVCEPQVIFDYSYFLERWMSTHVADLVAKESLNWLDGVRMICVLPGGNAGTIDPEKVIYSKTLDLGRKSLSRICSLASVPSENMVSGRVQLIFMLGDVPSDSSGCLSIGNPESVKRLADFMSKGHLLTRFTNRITTDAHFLKLYLSYSDNKTWIFIYKLFSPLWKHDSK